MREWLHKTFRSKTIKIGQPKVIPTVEPTKEQIQQAKDRIERIESSLNNLEAEWNMMMQRRQRSR